MRALDLARIRGAQYADVRVVNHREENLSVKDGIVEQLNSSETEGVGVRVLVNGAWGFASSLNLTNDEIDHIPAQAMDIAHASGLVRGEKVDLGPKVTSQGTYQTPVQIDPFSVSMEDKLALLMNADAELSTVQGVRTRQVHTTMLKEHKYFANSEGAYTEQTIIETGGGIPAPGVGGSEIQVRSYPNAFARQQVTGGWEAMLGWDLPGNGQRISSEAVALLTADPCPSNIITSLILGGSK